MLVNRFRWEDQEAAQRESRPFERVRCALVFDDVTRVQAQGLPADDGETVFSVLSIGFESVEDGAGRITMTLAGDGALALDAECINMRLMDLTRPWETGNLPDHGID